MRTTQDALRAQRSASSDLPIGQHHAALGPALAEIGERHPEVGPPNVAAERDEALIREEKLALHAERHAPCTAAAREIAHRAHQLDESRLVLEPELEDAQLL